MATVYKLKLDNDFVERVQKATRTTENFGIEPTQGLFGSPEWWDNIRSGALAIHVLRGTITRVYGRNE